jgi:hypothetical protein
MPTASTVNTFDFSCEDNKQCIFVHHGTNFKASSSISFTGKNQSAIDINIRSVETLSFTYDVEGGSVYLNNILAKKADFHSVSGPLVI